MLKYNPPTAYNDNASTQQPKKNALPILNTSTPSPPMEDIINSILPPRIIPTPDGRKLRQTVSAVPATRLDVIALQENLDRKLAHHQVKEMGVCPIRSAIYAEVFDELIRQITINCPERGLSLLKIRDDTRRTLEAHKVLYDASVHFAEKKAQGAEVDRPQLLEQISVLKSECAELEQKVLSMHMKCSAIEQREADRRQADEKRRADEMAFLQTTNKQLSDHLKVCLESTSKAK
eukprot:PhF_6_TR6364/c0_g1_i1/m.9625/K10410/DNALI; dynein light intermediate chain, axonemal